MLRASQCKYVCCTTTFVSSMQAQLPRVREALDQAHFVASEASVRAEEAAARVRDCARVRP